LEKFYFGKYKYTDSAVHNFHPLPKFVIIIVSIIVTGLTVSLLNLILIFTLFCILMVISRIKTRQIYSILKPFRFLLLFTFFVQLFFNDKGFNFNEPSYFTAVSTTGQFFLMIAFSALFTATTRPLDIIKILNLILKPLKILKVDTQNIAASGIIALRFIPLLFEEADKIKTAQILRNDTTKRGIKRLLDIEAFIIPLFLRVMYFSEQIAITLQFRGNWETICKLSKTKFSEILITLLYILILAGIYCV